MSVARQRRRGTTANHAAFTGLAGEVTIDTDKKVVVVHDGTTAGGFPHVRGSVGATDNRVVRADGTGTGTVQGSAVTVDDAGNITANALALSTALALNQGGTGATSASSARTSLGLGTFMLHTIMPWHHRGDAAMTLTDLAAGDAFLGKSNGNVAQFDATYYTHIRVTCRVTGAGTAGSKIVAKYRLASGGYSSTISDYVAIGTSAVETDLSATGVIASAWIPLHASAKADILLCPVQTGGDGATDPTIRLYQWEFKRE